MHCTAANSSAISPPPPPFPPPEMGGEHFLFWEASGPLHFDRSETLNKPAQLSQCPRCFRFSTPLVHLLTKVSRLCFAQFFVLFLRSQFLFFVFALSLGVLYRPSCPSHPPSALCFAQFGFALSLGVLFVEINTPLHNVAPRCSTLLLHPPPLPSQ